MKLNQVRLLVTHFDPCFRFYRDVIGLPVRFGGEGDVYADFDLGNDQALGLFKREMMAAAIGTQNLPLEAEAQDRSVVAFEVDDLDATLANLAQRGVELVAPPTERPDWGMRTAHLRDPDGNLIELFVSLPMEG